ncbi:ABC transporter ATP-binding protein [Corynebacterium sp. p3-SID1194]|uniref:ABC transporter ATP-binding protein n=1 Tax=Corynebacterium sp. p3-SID1194 TaxID=2916105 RepID=UPI0021A37204|nr:ABC transporter ATP-binding protein [Corynebacterium sp. p3-SID1194]MCT1449789.1 ABC transporter ATP-binding protein [Corynebacterium sp. p3-SID1194]
MEATKYEDPAVVAQNIGKIYKLQSSAVRSGLGKKKHDRDVDALRGVSFVVRKGESVGIVGRNGSGKSTLLRIIAGGEAATSGKIMVSAQPSLLGVSPALQGWLTGEQNIYLGLLALGMKPAEAKEAIPDIIEWTELGEAASRPMNTYSSGMGAKLSFAISTAISPEILLVDETLSTGDAAFAAKAQERMQGLLAGAGNLFLVSHSLGYVKQNCGRALWIHQGDLIADGPAEEVSGAYEEFSALLKTNDPDKAQQVMEACRETYPPMHVEFV